MLQLTLQVTDTIPIDGSFIVPASLADKSTDDIANTTTMHGNRRERVGDLFTINRLAPGSDIEVSGDCRSVKWIGACMAEGSIIVHGNAGHHSAAGMKGGRVEIFGDAGDYCGTAMRNGELRIRGSAGSELGGANPGERKGMRGGVILVDGSVGDGCGMLMRRGLIAVAGDSGERTGQGMIAGTIVITGIAGKRLGLEMKRGTIVVGAGNFLPPSPGFAGEGTGVRVIDRSTAQEPSPLFPLPQSRARGTTLFTSPFLELLWRTLERREFTVPTAMRSASFQLYRGDRINGGLGELLVAN